MKFLILFIVLALLSKLPLPHRSTKSRSFSGWLRLWESRQSFHSLHRHLKYFCLAIMPTALLAVVFYYLQPYAWGLWSVALEITLLLYVLSHINIQRYFKQYVEHLKAGETEAAFECAQTYLAVPEIDLENDVTTLNLQVLKVLLYRWFEYFFLMVFWYAVADVAGVLLAWFSVQYARSVDCDEQANRYLFWLEWLPVRLLGLTYGLAGNLTRALPIWKQHAWGTHTDNRQMLFDLATSALSHNGEERCWHSAEEHRERAVSDLEEWHALHLRSMSIWLVLLAIGTIGGWWL